MPAIYEHRLTVRDEELDEQGHVNNVEYLRWMQAAAERHSAARGWPADRYREHGVAWVVRSHSITYRRPAGRGDVIVVLTWVSDFRRVLSLRKYRIVRASDGSELAVAETDWAFVDRDSGSPRRIPPEVSGAFEVVSPDA